jgi:hypothetical protein
MSDLYRLYRMFRNHYNMPALRAWYASLILSCSTQQDEIKVVCQAAETARNIGEHNLLRYAEIWKTLRRK